MQENIQCTFIKIFGQLTTYDAQKGSFAAWSARIAINECLMRMRKAKKFLYVDDIEQSLDSVALPTFISDLDYELLIDKVNDLPTGYRTIFLLFVVDGLSHKEIAQQLGISENTSRTQLLKARKLLQKKILDLKKIRKII